MNYSYDEMVRLKGMSDNALIILNDEHYKSILTTMANFYDFDVYQIGMIAAQMPDATYLKTRKGWKKEGADVCVPLHDGIRIYDETKDKIRTYYDFSQVIDADGKDAGFIYFTFHLGLKEGGDAKRKHNEKKLIKMIGDIYEIAPENSGLDEVVGYILENELGLSPDDRAYAEIVKAGVCFCLRKRFGADVSNIGYDFDIRGLNGATYKALCETNSILQIINAEIDLYCDGCDIRSF